MFENGTVERLMAQRIRESAEDRIRDIGNEQAAQVLGLSVPGVETLLWRSEWSIETAVRVAAMLGLITEESVEKSVPELIA